MNKLSGPELVPPGPIKHAVIFLHGLGSNGDDLLALAPFFSAALASTAFLAPHAPLPIPFAAQGYQWFEYRDRTPAQIRDGLLSAMPCLTNYIRQAATRFGIFTNQIILCGFSQGTMTALHAGLSFDEELGGVIGFSGALLDPTVLTNASHRVPILLVHGALDDVVPLEASARAEKDLRSNGYDVNLINRPNLGHSIDEAGIREAVAFCQRIFHGATE